MGSIFTKDAPRTQHHMPIAQSIFVCRVNGQTREQQPQTRQPNGGLPIVSNLIATHSPPERPQDKSHTSYMGELHF